MKRLLPWLLLPYLTLVQAENTDPNSQKNLLNQVIQEAGETTFETMDVKSSQSMTTEEEPTIVQPQEVDLDQLTQSIAVRLSELLGTNTKLNTKEPSIRLETVVSDALRDGKKMDEIRSAVAQATADVIGQRLPLESDVPKTDQALTTGSSLGLNKVQNTTQITEKTIKQGGISEGNKILTDQAVDTQTTPATTIVLPGESLFRVAQRVYGEENGRRFLDIFAANRDIIKDINVVREGQVLTLPQVTTEKPLAVPTPSQ